MIDILQTTEKVKKKQSTVKVLIIVIKKKFLTEQIIDCVNIILLVVSVNSPKIDG